MKPINRNAVAAALLLAGCDVLAPSTELQVRNDLPVELAVRAAPCGQRSEAFAALAPGQSRTREVAPGCWRVEGMAADGRVGTVEVHIADGALQRIPFYVEN